MAEPWHGIFTIPITPFHADLSLDFPGLERVIDFCVAAGAHGVVYPVMASEFVSLDDAERRQAVECVLRRVNGRVPVVVGITGVNASHSLALAAHAQEHGASALIAMPPVPSAMGAEDATAFYRRLDAAVRVPIFIQNAAAYGGTGLPIDTVVALVRESRNIRYVKEEAPPSLHRIEQMARVAEGQARGVFGGGGGLMLLEELERGAAGTMPACEWTDVLARVYEDWRAGRSDEARALFQRLLPSIVMESHFGMAFAKAVLVERGIIACGRTRVGSRSLNDSDRAHIRAALDRLRDVLVKPYGNV
jgi:dihydrodipicolinate synthase/N-acetylneuraminate lyase